MGTITGANAIIVLSIPGVLNAPVQLQGFAADDVFNTEPIQSVETLMGVDGVMSQGFVFVSIKQMYSLQADSNSNSIFDQWWLAMQQAQDAFPASVVISLTTIGTKWNGTNGALTTYHPLPDTKKLLQPRRHGITWGRMFPAPTG